MRYRKTSPSLSALPAELVTVAVKFTCWPGFEGFRLDLMLVEVGAFETTTGVVVGIWPFLAQSDLTDPADSDSILTAMFGRKLALTR